MFKQVKSALFWYYIFKFRKKVMLIAFLLIIALFTNAIYVDVVEYLTLKEKLQFLEVALISKWLIIISSLLLCIYLIISMFSLFNDSNNLKVKVEKKKNNDIVSTKKNKKSNFSEREKEFLKKDLKSKADLLVER